jgi:hypothetical protein
MTGVFCWAVGRFEAWRENASHEKKLIRTLELSTTYLDY